MRIAVALACLLVAGLIPARAGAFDNVRKGFLMGASTGLGGQFFSVDPDNLSSTALATSLRFGLGLDPKTEVYVFNGGLTSVLIAYILPYPYTSGVTGLGLRRYLKSSSRSWFASAGAGVGSTSVFGFLTGYRGLGLMANVGFEWERHWSVELEGTYANASFAAVDGVSTIAVKVSGTAY